MSNLPEPGWYLDAFNTEPVELLGVAIHACVGCLFLVVRVSDEPRYELLRPSEWDIEHTLGDGSKVRRFMRIVQGETT